MKTFTYISGPPCVGKSSLAKVVQNAIPSIEYIGGDSQWSLYSHLPFADRVAVVNQGILKCVQQCKSSDILCEWVPTQGSFVSALAGIVDTVECRFLHVALTASVPELKKRKMERDGNEDIDPDPNLLPEKQNSYDCLVFDTEVEEVTVYAKAIVNRIMYNKGLLGTA